MKQKRNRQLLNENGVIEPYQLVLIVLLIFASVTSVVTQCSSSKISIKELTDFVDIQLLGNTWTGLYQEGYNVNEPFTEIAMFQDMNQHFQSTFSTLQNFIQNQSFVMSKTPKRNVKVQIIFLNKTSLQLQGSLKQTDNYFKSLNLKQFLISLDFMKIDVIFGDSKLFDNLILKLEYKMHRKLMLQVNLEFIYEENMGNISNLRPYMLRKIEQIFSILLVFSYLKKINYLRISYKRQENNLLSKDRNIKNYPLIFKIQSSSPELSFINNQLFWCYSLVFLGICTIVSSKIAPMTSLLQLLPILEQQNEKKQIIKKKQLNFNASLRYALPHIIRILIPVYIFLNGVIMYSIIMYPGDYFDDYMKGFFSYMYNNFQVGTYQNFTQIEQRGTLAYIVYLGLYFYMVLVGNSLITGLFGTLIQIAITERQIQVFVKEKVKKIQCPNCLQHNFNEDSNLQINITSPKLSPFTRSIINNSQKAYSKLYIEQEVKFENGIQFVKIKMSALLNYIQLVKNQVNKNIKNITKQENMRNKLTQLQKIEKMIQQFESETQ